MRGFVNTVIACGLNSHSTERGVNLTPGTDADYCTHTGTNPEAVYVAKPETSSAYRKHGPTYRRHVIRNRIRRQGAVI